MWGGGGESTGRAMAAARGGGRTLFSREERLSNLQDLRAQLKVPDGKPLVVAGIGAGAWGAVFVALLQEAYGEFEADGLVQVRIWRRPGKQLSKSFAERLFATINADEELLSRLTAGCSYLKYVDARCGKRTLLADEVLRDGFSDSLPGTPLVPLNVVTSLEECAWDAHLVVNGLPSTDTKDVFRRLGLLWRERAHDAPVVISLSKGVEFRTKPHAHIVTPGTLISLKAKVPVDRVFYFGGPNIAAEIFTGEYANARLCGRGELRGPVARFVRTPQLAVWENDKIIMHEVMGGLKNIYAVGSGIVEALCGSATSSSVYFAHALSEMNFITRICTEQPEAITGPLLADTYVTMLKGRNAWYGRELASGRVTRDEGDHVAGKGFIQGPSTVDAFYQLLSSDELAVPHPITGEESNPISQLPVLDALHAILFGRGGECVGCDALLAALRDRDAFDPLLRVAGDAERSLYKPTVLRTVPEVDEESP